MRRLLMSLFVFFVLLPIVSYAQTVPLDQKEWYSKSTRGVVPPTWPFGGGAPAESYVENNGLLNSLGRACMQSADANCNATVVAPPGVVWEVRVRDGDGASLSDVTQSNSASVANNLWSLLVKNLTYGYNAGGTEWWAVGAETIGNAITGRTGLVAAAAMYAYNVGTVSYGTVMMQMPAASFSTQAGLITTNQNMAYDFTNSHWDPMRSDTNGALIVNQSTSFPGYDRLQDGDSTVLQDVEDNQADGKATTLNGSVTSSILYAYNGATLDMLRVGASKELQVTDIATRPGEDAGNDWRKIKKQATGTYSPAKETTANIAGAAVVVLASKEIIGYPNWCIYLANNDGADPLTDVDVQVSPDNFATASSTIDLAEPVQCDTLAAGAGCVSCYSGSSFRYVRVRATAHAVNQVSSLDAWITANVN